MPTKRLEISVTAEHIEEGVRKSSSHCMTKEAIKSAIPDATRISVDIQTIRYTLYGRRYTYLTPRSVQEAIIDWDGGILIEPFNFRFTGRAHIREVGPRIDENAKRRLVRREGTNKGHIPNVVGGRPIPLSSFSTRREFGLRAFRRPGSQG